MSLSEAKLIYGIHSITPYNRTTRLPIGFLRVTGDSSLELKGEYEDLAGGSNLYNWDSELKSISSEMSITAREYPPEIMQLMFGADLTEYGAESTGEIVDIENVNGTAYDTSTGIATITVTTDEEDDLKEGTYIVKVVSASTVDVYAYTNVDFARGTSKVFVNDDLKITSAPLTITTSGDTEIADFGITLTGGDGTIGMTVDDTFVFTVRRPTVTGFKLDVGSMSSSFSQFGCIITAQKKSDDTICYIDAYKVVAAGMPIQFKEKGYSEWSSTFKLLYDSSKDKVFSIMYNR